MTDIALPTGRLMGPLAGALILVGALGALWLFNSELTDGDEADAQKAVAAMLLDPASAEFRNVRVNGHYVCGEVNGKDRRGSYTGFTRFYVAGPDATFDPAKDGWPLGALPPRPGAFEDAWTSNCR